MHIDDYKNYERDLLIKLYEFLGSRFGCNGFVSDDYNPEGTYDCYECGNDQQNVAIIELRAYIKCLRADALKILNNTESNVKINQ